MKILNSIFHLYWFSFLLLLFAGCNRSSDHLWNSRSIGVQSKNSATIIPDLDSESQEEFIPLNETDLKHQFSTSSVSYSQHDLGEKGIPTAEEFEDPKGKMASLFQPIFFDTDQFNIKDEKAFSLIYRIAAYLKSHPNTYVIIEGHCDERGPEAYNLALGTKRSNQVKKLLLKEKVHPDQIHTISYGKEKPFSKGHDPESWAKNRRAHFRVYTK